MFDFRYHALSLVAVFLALMIGLLLGVAIGDKGLVSSAEHNLRASLRSDVRAAQADAAKLRTQLADQKRFQDAVYPLLVQGRLSGQRIGLVGMGGLPDGTIREVRDALQGTGGQFAGVAVVRGPEDTNASPSQIGWFRGQRISSVDDLDQVAGKAALVFVLTGANGSFGVKDSAQALLPGAAGGG